MDNNTARLELFRQAINTQAQAEADEIVRQSEEKCAALAKEKSARTSGEAVSAIREEYARTAAAYKKELSRLDYEMKKAVLARRSELVDGLFEEIRAKLAEFTAGSGYADYLKNAISRALSALGESGTVIYARPADLEAVKRLTALPVEPDHRISLGGISAGNTVSGLFTDLTLDSRLRDAQADFSGRSELRL